MPAFNEAATISGVVSSLREHVPGADIVVVNDGSFDDTGVLARQKDVAVLDMPFNVGIGAAVQAGLLYALRNGYDVAIQVDGDGQHPASEVVKLTERLARGDCDLVIGSRFVQESSYRGRWTRRVGIAMFTLINVILLRRRVADSTSGFRAFNRAAVEFLAADYPHDYPEPESIVTLCRNGFRVVEVPVTMDARHAGRSSITRVRSVYYMIKVAMAMIFASTRKKRRTP